MGEKDIKLMTNAKEKLRSLGFRNGSPTKYIITSLQSPKDIELIKCDFESTVINLKGKCKRVLSASLFNST